MLNIARAAILIALALNLKRALAIPLPPESDHEWMALILCMILGVLEAAAFIALGSRKRGATFFVYSLGGLGLAAVVTHAPMLVHMIRDNEPGIRRMLIHALQQALAGTGANDLPARQNRRTPLIEAALEPARDQFEPASRDRLTKALALVIGTESRLVFRDVLQLDEDETRAVKSWIIRALTEAALRRGA